MDLDAIRRAFRDPDDAHEPITSLVTLENTHADSMAQPLPAEYVARRRRASPTSRACRSTSTGRASSTPSVALGTPARELLARGRLGHLLPVEGPRLPGRLGRRRQRATSSGGRAARASWSAAACARPASSPRPGSIALRDGPTGMIERLAEDHANARRLAEGLAGPARHHRSRPGPRAHRTSCSSSWPGPSCACRSSTALEPRGRADDRLPGRRPDPRRHPLRHRGGRHRRGH